MGVLELTLTREFDIGAKFAQQEDGNSEETKLLEFLEERKRQVTEIDAQVLAGHLDIARSLLTSSIKYGRRFFLAEYT